MQQMFIEGQTKAPKAPECDRIGATISAENEVLEVFLFDKNNELPEGRILRLFSVYLNDLCKFAINHGHSKVRVKTQNLTCPDFDPRAVLNRGEAYQALIERINLEKSKSPQESN